MRELPRKGQERRVYAGSAQASARNAEKYQAQGIGPGKRPKRGAPPPALVAVAQCPLAKAGGVTYVVFGDNRFKHNDEDLAFILINE